MKLKSTNRAELLEGGSDARFRQLVYDLFTISTHMQSVRDHIAGRIGVTGPQYSILLAIAEMGNDVGVGVKRVAEHLHVSGAFVTAETGKLIKAGYLNKQQDSDDRRAVRLTLSTKGRREIEVVLPELRQVNDVFFSGLNKSEFEALSDIIAGMIDGAEQATENATSE
tara:strand:- start:1197 stop:1700 length:504 start_codon:yes stop_codon:yes gene_type:complete